MAKKRFVLDTNVLLHDPSVIFKFEDNILVISPVVLEELDALKVQSRSVSADARQVIRLLDELLNDVDTEVLRSEGIKRNEEGGLLVIPTLLSGSDLMSELASGNNDKRIIRDALLLQKMDMDKTLPTPRKAAKTKASLGEEQHGVLQTIFVSKDINARLIARSAGLMAEDYKASQVKSETDEMSTGFLTPNPDEVWNCKFECNEKNYRFNRKEISECLGLNVYPHLMVQMTEDGYLHFIDITEDSAIAVFRKESESPEAFDIEPIGIRQAAALTVLSDENIPLVILTGTAGSGKTLLTLATGLQNKIELKTRKYNKIIASRAANDLDRDIGFLPGTEEEKVSPWLGAIKDNIEVLFADAEDMESVVEFTERHIQYRSINFMRGRSIQDSYFILDEAQNLTPHQIKTLVTRIGKGSKIVVLGDLSQIDNPFLSQYSSGLTYLIEKMKDSSLAAHIHLQGSPRSPLSEDAGNRL